MLGYSRCLTISRNHPFPLLKPPRPGPAGGSLQCRVCTGLHDPIVYRCKARCERQERNPSQTEHDSQHFLRVRFLKISRIPHTTLSFLFIPFSQTAQSVAEVSRPRPSYTFSPFSPFSRRSPFYVLIERAALDIRKILVRRNI